MDKQKLAQKIKEGNWDKLFAEKTINQLKEMSQSEIKIILDEITGVPIKYSQEISGPIFRLHFTLAWKKVFNKIELPDKQARVLEIASGSTDPVPQALEIYTDGKGQYVSANLNKKLTRGLKEKTANLDIKVRVVEDNALNLKDYFPLHTFAMVAFQHAINDMIQTIVADRENLDTVNRDWFEILPDMVQAVTAHYRQDTLKEVAYDQFIKEIEVCTDLLKSGGFLVFNTHVFQIDLDCGYPLELYGNFIPLARKWLAHSGLPLTEVRFSEFAPKWWLFLQKQD